VGGCGSETVEKQRDRSADNLKLISRAYIDETKDLERPPSNLEELTPSLKKLGEPAEILQSPHDGQDYTILYGVDPLTALDQGNRFVVLVYEKVGVNGKRFVGGFRKVKRMTDEEFRAAPFPPGYKAPE